MTISQHIITNTVKLEQQQILIFLLKISSCMFFIDGTAKMALDLF